MKLCSDTSTVGDALRRRCVDHLADAAMVGIEDLSAPRLGGIAGEAFIAGNDGRFADARDRTCGVRRPVAVDHQPRIALRDQMRIEMFRQRVGDAGNADVPGDMPCQLVLRQAEIAEPRGMARP